MLFFRSLALLWRWAETGPGWEGRAVGGADLVEDCQPSVI